MSGHFYRVDSNGRDWLFLGPEGVTPKFRTDEALRAILEPTGVSLEQVRGESRKRSVVSARWMLMAHIVNVMGKSSTEAGRMLNKDHTGVLYGVAKEKFRLTGIADPILLKKGHSPNSKPYAGNIPPRSLRCSLAA